ncbi:hypothetical protein [Microbacterium sp. WCS2018Hpa-9]|uniref:hypothetical protein n=1 Tax=Microbacterium sp. WCS2018Hpa-9 TaxID=3073635 RepID=UPI00288A1823|nr:hypothetical protein [Microbacterium sp. WCS2018Hpa-9]
MTDRIDDQSGAFAAALRAAISDRGITLARLRSQLIDDGNRVSMATLSYWRSGDRQPEGPQSLSVVDGIEDRLGLHRGHLGSLLVPTSRLGPIAPPVGIRRVTSRGRRAADHTAISTGIQD